MSLSHHAFSNGLTPGTDESPQSKVSLCCSCEGSESGICIHATCPLTLARRNPGGETRSGFTLFPSWLSDGCTQLAPHKGPVLLAWSHLPALIALVCFLHPTRTVLKITQVMLVFLCGNKQALLKIMKSLFLFVASETRFCPSLGKWAYVSIWNMKNFQSYLIKMVQLSLRLIFRCRTHLHS